MCVFHCVLFVHVLFIRICFLTYVTGHPQSMWCSWKVSFLWLCWYSVYCVKGSGHVRLTTILPSVVSRCPEDVGASTSHTPMGLHSLFQGQLYLLQFNLYYKCQVIKALEITTIMRPYLIHKKWKASVIIGKWQLDEMYVSIKWWCIILHLINNVQFNLN
jgi:hypothetical protein